MSLNQINGRNELNLEDKVNYSKY